MASTMPRMAKRARFATAGAEPTRPYPMTEEREACRAYDMAEVLEYVQRKSGDVDRWLRGMQRLKQRFHDRA